MDVCEMTDHLPGRHKAPVSFTPSAYLFWILDLVDASGHI